MNMKKIFLLFAAVGLFFACDPTHEKIGNGGHITLEELLQKTTVKTNIAPSGNPGNVITCETLAPVNAVWDIAGKTFVSTSAKRKMKPGEYAVKLTALCADGTVLEADFLGIKCVDITDPLEKIYIYGGDPEAQPEFWLEPGDAAGGRFSDSEGKYLPYLSDEVYWGFKTLVFEITDAQEGPFIWGSDVGLTMRVMNGWWSATYADDVVPTVGLWELQLTEDIAKDCAKGNGGSAKDLDLLMTRGRIKIKSVYYEE